MMGFNGIASALCGLSMLVASAATAQNEAALPAEKASKMGAIILKPRIVPAPALASPMARASVERNAEILRAKGSAASLPRPPASDTNAWKRIITAGDAAYAPMVEAIKAQARATVEKTTIAGVTVYAATPLEPRPARAKKIILHVHGGGFAMLADGTYADAMAAQTATTCGCRTYSVNYRAPPDHPYPAALDDVLSVYRELLKTHPAGNIAFQGESAGGNIAAAAILKARDQGLPMPSMLVLGSAGLDLTRSGDSHSVNEGLDMALSSGIASLIELYAGGADLKSPYLSPVAADFSKGFPPTFLKAGGREILLSDSIAMHRALRRAGVPAELHIWEGMSHGPFGTPADPAPEDREIPVEIDHFMTRIWGG